MRRLAVGALSIGLLTACSNNSSGGEHNLNNNGNNTNTGCPEGTELSITACVPVFDECPAEDEIPVLGGGCHAVGVERCAAGSGCATGFAGDTTGGCEPVLPSASCDPGSMSVLGNSGCEPVGPCGSTTWGSAPDTPGTVYVNGSYGGGNSDGSQSRPYTTIGHGLSAADATGIVAVAAGTYVERLVLNKPVTLYGRCASQVTIQGPTGTGNQQTPMRVQAAGSGATIRGVSLTGGHVGLNLFGALGVTVEEVEIINTGADGLLMQGGSTASLRRVRITGATSYGILMYGGHLAIRESIVRDTAANADGAFGHGIDAGYDINGPGTFATVDATGLVLSGNRVFGLVLSGGAATLRGSVVENTQASENQGLDGYGIAALCDHAIAACPDLTLLGSVVRGNRTAGVYSVAEHTIIRDSVIRETQPRQNNSELGHGLAAECDGHLESCGTLELTCSLLDGNRLAGLSVVGVSTVVEDTLFRNQNAQQSNLQGGYGLYIGCNLATQTCAAPVVRRSGLVSNRFAGISVYGPDVTLEGIYVSNTRPAEGDQGGGMAISAQCDSRFGACPSLAIDASLFESSRTHGLSLYQSSGTLSRSSVIEVDPRVADDQFGYGIYIDGANALVTPTFDASYCEVRNATLAGMFYAEANGSVTRSLIWGADYSVALEGAEVVIDDLSEIYGVLQNEPLLLE